MRDLQAIPELLALGTRSSPIRIPPEIDVPLTSRVRAILDTAEFRRLAKVGQLGLVVLAYPGATHSRFEHSLGVYRLMLLFLQQLSDDERFRAAVTVPQAERAIVAALVHDIAHWPFCHPIEDLRLPEIPHHEQSALAILESGELAEVLRNEWKIEPADIARLLMDCPRDAGERIVCSLLSGPIDVDKMDYLMRDSLHAGVPYGRNFDQQRLIGGLCLDARGEGLAITDKGRTAAEMMVFARYVMFSEVYWHHTVRAATAMLQRAYYASRERLNAPAMMRMTDDRWIETLRAEVAPQAAALVEGLFGARRKIHKRLAQFNILEHRALYERMARRPYEHLLRVSERFAELCSQLVGRDVAPHEVLFDAPPVEREIEFDLDVRFGSGGEYRRLGELSPVVRTLAREQFDDYVKRVRIYVDPALRRELPATVDLPELTERAIRAAEAG